MTSPIAGERLSCAGGGLPSITLSAATQHGFAAIRRASYVARLHKLCRLGRRRRGAVPIHVSYERRVIATLLYERSGAVAMQVVPYLGERLDDAAFRWRADDRIEGAALCLFLQPPGFTALERSIQRRLAGVHAATGILPVAEWGAGEWLARRARSLEGLQPFEDDGGEARGSLHPDPFGSATESLFLRTRAMARRALAE
jgi:hypothetical protein